MSDTVRLKTTVGRDLFDAAQACAVADGTNVAALLRDLLTAHVAARSSNLVPLQIAPEEWADLLRWMRDNPDILAAYSGPRKNLTPDQRVALMAWARQNGYSDD